MKLQFNKLRIGIYLGTHPKAGGSFQYNLSILKAAEYLQKQGNEITVFSDLHLWEEHVRQFQNVIIKSRSFFNKVLYRLFGMFFGDINFLKRYASYFWPIVDSINESNCDLIVYPSQDPISYICEKKSLVTIHDLMHRYASHFEEYKNGEVKSRDLHYSRICNSCTGILVDSSVGKQHVIESYTCKENKIYPLPFVPPSYLEGSIDVDVLTKFNIPKKYLFYPAQFWEHKNHINLVKSIDILVKRGVDVNLVLVGSKKNNYKRSIDLIYELGLERRIYILGYVSNDDMASLYKSAVALVFASLIGPTNIPPLEAMLLGCPVVCSNAYAMPEQLGNAALFFDPQKPDEIAKALKTIWLEDSVRKELVSNGNRKILNWTQKDFNKNLEEILFQVLES